LSGGARSLGGKLRGCGPGECGFALSGRGGAHGCKGGKPGDGGKGGKPGDGGKGGEPGDSGRGGKPGDAVDWP